jgi:flagellar export protein FliJ
MQTYRKIKRVQPIIKMKKQKMDEEAAVLEAIRAEKLELVRAMKENQRRYMDGVEKLNKIRTSPVRSNLETMESGLDYVKSEWYKLYKNVQDIEGKEKSQIARLLTAERELKSVEKLAEKYQSEFQKEVGKAEQKMLDATALRRFNTKPQGQGQ